MVVEDESFVAMLVEHFLEDLGCHVVAAASRLPEAMLKAAELTLDAAVLDVNLAGALSYPVAELLRDKGVWVVFATGYGVSGLRPDLRDAPVLAKPFNQDQLEKALIPALARPGGTAS
jgi:CheY-like chemotaxis protein